VKLAGLACRPCRVKLAGIAAALVLGLAGCSGDGADRTVNVEAFDHGYRGMEGFTARVGEKVRFSMRNSGPDLHELVVTGPDRRIVGLVAPTGVGRSRHDTVEFKLPGTYTFACFVGDHLLQGMKGSFQVS
jgi:plastocyanin